MSATICPLDIHPVICPRIIRLAIALTYVIGSMSLVVESDISLPDNEFVIALEVILLIDSLIIVTIIYPVIALAAMLSLAVNLSAIIGSPMIFLSLITMAIIIVSIAIAAICLSIFESVVTLTNCLPICLSLIKVVVIIHIGNCHVLGDCLVAMGLQASPAVFPCLAELHLSNIRLSITIAK